MLTARLSLTRIAIAAFLVAALTGGAPAQAEDESPTVPGFGVEQEETETVPGFGADAGAVARQYSDRVTRYVERLMDRYDKDGNDILDAEEMKTVPWSSDPKKSDLNGDGQISQAEMNARIAKRWGEEERRRSSQESSSSTSRSKSKETQTPSSKIRRYAQALLSRYDKNKNGVLDRDEWEKMSGPASRADANNNGTITLDELAAKLGDYGRGGESSKSTSSPASRSGYRSHRTSSRPSGDKKVYRIVPPTERLPRGLPDWFSRNDANADGQIVMSEFSASWSDSKAKEFSSHDANGDGIITPAECLAAEKIRR